MSSDALERIGAWKLQIIGDSTPRLITLNSQQATDLRALVSELEAARGDVQRLDWMDEHKLRHRDLHWNAHFQSWYRDEPPGIFFLGETLREAIDAARAPQDPPREPQ